MSGKELLLVALQAPSTWWNEIDQLRKKYESPDLGRIPPHVTVLVPHEVETEEIDAAKSQLDSAAKSVNKFVLSVGTVRRFHPNPVLYLSIGGELDALAQLHGASIGGVLADGSGFEFHPHMTITRNVDDELVDRGIEEVAWVPRDWVVDKVTLFQLQDHSQAPRGRRWNEIHSAELGAS